MKKNEIYVTFSLDYSGEVEYIDQVVKNGVDITDDVDDLDLTEFVEKLTELDEFYVSDHRTEVEVWLFDDNTMNVHFRYFNEPEDGEFDEHELNGIPRIDIVGL